jgi:ADP-heptose:LPS heptosyltransferase
MLAPLARARGVAFYSLQKGPPAAQAAAPPPGMQLVDPGARLRNFADTAALASHLDLVITIDTSVAHLAGAMGRPTWVLVTRVPDWRYHLERADNPWYPTMRLFRQQADGEWSEAIARVAHELEALASER